jgi:hypothetical protein
MTTDAAPDPRFLDGDALRVARVKALEKAFAVALTPDEAARCTSVEETTAVLVARVGAVPGAPNLRAGALAAVREGLREVARADRESVGESTPLAPLFPRWKRTRRWHALGRELECKLPLVRWRPWVIAVVGPIVALHVAFIDWYPSHHYVEEGTIVELIALAVLGVAGVLTTTLLVELPERMTVVGKLVTWLVAQRPAAFRAGTGWTTGQVEETVDAVHRLSWLPPGCWRLLMSGGLVALLTLALVGTSLWLCVLGLVSREVVGPLPPGLR